MAASVSNGHSDERLENPLMENGICNFPVGPLYKRRKVSAVRDFPEGCGPSAARIGPVLKVNTSGFGSDNVEDKNEELSFMTWIKNEKLSGADIAGTSQLEDDSHSNLPAEALGQTIDCCLKKENPMVSSHQLNGPLLENNDSEKVPLVGMGALAEAELERTPNSANCESSPVDELALPVSSKSLASHVDIVGSNAYMEKILTKSHFRRRKVSAVRDFPPLCGRNVPCLSKDEDLKGNDKTVVQQKMAPDDDDPLKKVAATYDKEVERSIQDEYACKRKLADLDLAGCEGNVSREVQKLDVLDPSSRMKLQQENKREYNMSPKASNHHLLKLNSKTVVKESNALQVASDRKVVLGLMSKPECPWTSDDGSAKVKLIGLTKQSKGKEPVKFSRFGRSKVATKTKFGADHPGQKPLKKKIGNVASSDIGQLVTWEKKDSVGCNENVGDSQAVKISHDIDVNVTPSVHHNLSHENDSSVTRHKVRETLRLFQVVARKLLQEIEGKRERASSSKRVDLQAAKILKEKGKYLNTGNSILGHVPGVEVGDEFQYRVELNIVGLHRQIQGGIDYVKHKGKVLATSIVASGGYADDLENSDVLVYTGQGGNVMNTDKAPEDQKLERGNLALKNSSDEKNPVRVIRGSESADGKSKTYVYDGMYIVESCWQDIGSHGKLVYKFRLRRMPGQPELAWKELKKSKKFKTREGLCVVDISFGKERIPICAVNTIDDDKPPPFTYITSMIFPDCDLIAPEGCGCTNGCSDVETCSCAVRNGGEIPFNHNGAIVESKPLVYECGPRCKCPSTCHNRVSQHGIRFQLEIFKTNSRGWGVRSLNSIPSGSFICEYIGELLEDKEAEQRTGNDEYLFDIGNKFSNSTLWGGLSTVIPEAQLSSCEAIMEGGFTIDAAQYGNVGRFINHSCSPNLVAQNVLYDHLDKRMPHIMFFAAENIPPLQELAYDYNYAIDQVRDSEGNIKRKDCYCGSVECSGRLY